MLTPLKKADVAKRRPMRERRQSARAASIRDVRAILPSGQSIAARLLNVSEGGALIAVPSSLALPDEFHLVDEGQRISVTVVRRLAARVAVRFKAAAD